MPFQLTIQPYPREELLSFLDFLLPALVDHGIHKVQIMFGWLWSKQVPTWQDIDLDTEKLKDEVRRVESLGDGNIGDDDLVIRVPSEELEIELCHEADVHVTFSRLSPLVSSIVGYLSDSFPAVLRTRASYTSPVYLFPSPTFFVSTQIRNLDPQPKVLRLQPSGRSIELQPGEEVTVQAYASAPGLMGLTSNDDFTEARGWPGSKVRVLKKGTIVLETL